MKITTLLMTALATLAVSSSSFATVYYQNQEGTVKKITLDEFKNCNPKTVIYRGSEASQEIPSQFVRPALEATVKGNDYVTETAAAKKLEETSGVCTYSGDELPSTTRLN